VFNLVAEPALSYWVQVNPIISLYLLFTNVNDFINIIELKPINLLIYFPSSVTNVKDRRLQRCSAIRYGIRNVRFAITKRYSWWTKLILDTVPSMTTLIRPSGAHRRLPPASCATEERDGSTFFIRKKRHG
jgi:hypothetical protein